MTHGIKEVDHDQAKLSWTNQIKQFSVIYRGNRMLTAMVKKKLSGVFAL